MSDAANKRKRNSPGCHFVITCDEAGIFEAFNFVKDRLVSNKGDEFLSLIYTISDKNIHPLYNQELSILEKRFSDFLMVHILRINTLKYCFEQEILEATINSNTMSVMKFSIFGLAEFVNYVAGVLRFLDVEVSMIKSKTI